MKYNKIGLLIGGLLSEHVQSVEWEKTQLQELDITGTDLTTECLTDLLTRLPALRWLSAGQQDAFNDSVLHLLLSHYFVFIFPTDSIFPKFLIFWDFSFLNFEFLPMICNCFRVIWQSFKIRSIFFSHLKFFWVFRNALQLLWSTW